jgi:hypothetical protein
MNYIEQIKGFWRSHDVETYPTNVIALYFYLLEVNNKTSWSVSFKRNNSKICADLGISYPTLNNSRNRLKQSGLIDFKTQNGNANVTYTLKEFLKVTNEVSVEVTNEVTNEVGSRLFKSKDKLKQKLKLNNISSVAKAPEEKEPTKFWKSFVDIWFRRYDEVTGAKPTFNPAAAKNLKSIIQRLEKMYFDKNNEHWEEVKALITFNKFIDNALRDDWLKSNFLLTNLSTQFDKIINQPKNGTKSNTTGTTSSNSGYKSASIDTAELIQQLTDDAENGNIPGQYS